MSHKTFENRVQGTAWDNDVLKMLDFHGEIMRCDDKFTLKECKFALKCYLKFADKTEDIRLGLDRRNSHSCSADL